MPGTGPRIQTSGWAGGVMAGTIAEGAAREWKPKASSVQGNRPYRRGNASSSWGELSPTGTMVRRSGGPSPLFQRIVPGTGRALPSPGRTFRTPGECSVRFGECSVSFGGTFVRWVERSVGLGGTFVGFGEGSVRLDGTFVFFWECSVHFGGTFVRFGGTFPRGLEHSPFWGNGSPPATEHCAAGPRGNGEAPNGPDEQGVSSEATGRSEKAATYRGSPLLRHLQQLPRGVEVARGAAGAEQLLHGDPVELGAAHSFRVMDEDLGFVDDHGLRSLVGGELLGELPGSRGVGGVQEEVDDHQARVGGGVEGDPVEGAAELVRRPQDDLGPVPIGLVDGGGGLLGQLLPGLGAGGKDRGDALDAGRDLITP